MQDTTFVTALLTAEMVEALDTWIAGESEPRPSREQAVAMAVCEWLAAMRLVPAHACADGVAA